MAKTPKQDNTADLLAALTADAPFTVPSSQGPLQYKQLNTGQLRSIIETVIDTPIAGSLFSTAMSTIMKECLIDEKGVFEKLNADDRVVFSLATRIYSLSPTATVEIGGSKQVIDLQSVLDNLVGSYSFASEETIDLAEIS